MKLFLSSLSISENQKECFANLVGKPLADISLALIENAADPYQEGDKGFVFETRENLQSLGIKLQRIDLSQYINKSTELSEVLKNFDVIWIGGGNTYYIRWLMKQSGFDSIIKKIVDAGVVYGGGSAGAIVAGETLKYFDLVDDPKYAPEVMYTGLGLTNTIFIPHWKTETIQSKLEEIKHLYEKDGFGVLAIKDDEVLLIDGDVHKIV